MDTMEFFDYLAKNAHYNLDMDDLLGKIPTHVQTAYLCNDTENLKLQLANYEYLANEVDVVQIYL